MRRDARQCRIRAVKLLLDTGRCWYKLAGCYESSLTGEPGFDDIAAITRALAAHAPARIVWGTNWPHNLITDPVAYPNDADLLDRVLRWLPDDNARSLAVVDNPAELVGVPEWEPAFGRR